MFYDLLWGVFLIEWLVGISVGWLLANYYWRRKDSRAPSLTEQDNQDLALPRTDGSGPSGRVGVVQALAQDRATIQKQVLRLEQSLAQTEVLLKKTNNDLAAARTAQAQSDANLRQREREFESLKAKLAGEQASNAAMVGQVAQYQKAAAEAEALAKALDQSKSDLSKTAIRLEANLEEALQSRTRALQQLAVYKERLRVAMAELERAESVGKDPPTFSHRD